MQRLDADYRAKDEEEFDDHSEGESRVEKHKREKMFVEEKGQRR